MTPELLFAAGSGLSISLIGISIRAASGKNIDPLRVFFLLAAAGFIFFLPTAITAELRLPAIVLGLFAGVTQYAAARLYRTGLALGPLTPLWCALLLGFLEPIAWSAVVHGTRLTPGHWIAVVFTIAGVIMSSRLSHNGSAAPAGMTWKYLGLLVTVLLINGIANVCLVEADARGWKGSFPQLMAALYASAAACSWLELMRGKRAAAERWAAVLPWGLMAAVGSIGGMSLLQRCIQGNPGLVFTVQACASITGAALAGLIFFRERATFTWRITVALVAGAVFVAGI